MPKIIKVLAADDQDINLRLLTLILKDENFELLLTDDGDGTIEMLKAHPDTAIILLDRMLYEEDGMETVKRLKGMPEFKHIPIIMITTSWSPELEAGALEAGVFAYMPKPYNKAKIISTVKAALKTV